MTTYFFGERWDAPAVDPPDAVQVATPVGAVCYDCDEPIVDGERGFLRAVGRLDSRLGSGTVGAIHMECDMRGILSHSLGVCRCHTGREDTPREEARATLAALNERRAQRGEAPL